MQTDNKQLRLVIVDDEPRVAKSLEREIRIHYSEKEFAIRSYNDPLEYLGGINDTEYEDFLVISDLRMPTMNGADLLERVRAADPNVQTVLMTAYSDMDDIRRAISANIRSLMPKPWNQPSLYAEIDGALSEFRLRKENARLKMEIAQQISMAGDFQKAILAAIEPPPYPALSLAYSPFKAQSCSGDYYDAFELPDGKTALLVGDVAGHGIKPALVTFILKTVVQGCRYSRKHAFSTPASLLSELNDDLCSLMAASPDMIVAFAVAFIDPAARTLTVANAGLPDVLLCAGGRVKERFSCAGPALGFERKQRYIEKSVRYDTGDSLVMHTDGLIDEVEIEETRVAVDAVNIIAESIDGGLDAGMICEAHRISHDGEPFRDDVTLLIATL